MSKTKGSIAPRPSKALSEEWTKKLKASGFRDDESEYDKEFSTVRKVDFAIDGARLAYMRQCETYLTIGKFKDETDRFIFEKHCEGCSNHAVAEMLKNTEKSLDRRTVDRRLSKMLEAAHIKPIVFNF